MAYHTDPIALPAAAADSRREALFRETAFEKAERLALGLAWAAAPSRLRGLPNLTRVWLKDLVAPSHDLPDPAQALEEPYGLAGIVHDLSLPTLLAAYRRGLYPFAHIAPNKWWAPSQRSLLFFDELHIAKRLRRQMRQGQYTVTFDRDFDGVMKACAGNRTGRWHVTWITPKIMHAFAQAHDAGYAHSFEVWNEKGELAGGGYGLAIGGTFATESQFSRETNTSKIGFTVLNWHLAKWGFAFNDGKMLTPTTRDMGFREIPRDDYMARLTQGAAMPDRIGRWQVETDMATVADWQPQAGKDQPVKQKKIA